MRDSRSFSALVWAGIDVRSWYQSEKCCQENVERTFATACFIHDNRYSGYVTVSSSLIRRNSKWKLYRHRAAQPNNNKERFENANYMYSVEVRTTILNRFYINEIKFRYLVDEFSKCRTYYASVLFLSSSFEISYNVLTWDQRVSFIDDEKCYVSNC